MPKKQKPTPQQQAFIDALVDPAGGNLCMRARAGTGKSTTIVLGVDAYTAKFPDHEVVVCAYNKSITDEMKAKLAEHGHTDWRRCSAATAHSLGLGTFKWMFKPEIDDKKVRKIVDGTRDTANSDEQRYLFQAYGAQIVALVGMAKQAGFGFFPDLPVADVASWHRLADHFDINGLDDTQEAEAVVDAAQRVYRASLAQTDVVDFDDMILFPLVKNIRVKFTKDLVIVDEAQDLSRARQALLRKFIKPGGRMVVVGDDRQCHPTGTEVYVTGRGYTPIEQLKVGDRVASYHSGGSYFPGTISQGRRVEAIQGREYQGELIKITAEGFGIHEVTPNHRCLVRMVDRPGSVVYVMKLGDHARVGRCKSKYGGDFGMSSRARQEKADAAWAVRFFTAEQEDEAQLFELQLAYQYGLPQLCFHYGWENGLSTEKRAQFWRDFPSNRDGLQRCLADHGLDEELPFWHQASGKHVGGKYSFLLTAANLHDGWMRVCAFSGDRHKPNWVEAQISRRSYKGRVWSLKVQPTEGGRRLYIANGIVTHNSIYGFAGADTSSLPNLIEGLNATVLPLSVTWRCPKAVVALAQTIVPDIEAAPAAPEGEVLRVPLIGAAAMAGSSGALTEPASWYDVLVPKLGPTDAVLCRNTAPLIKLAYQLIRARVPCKVEGRAIGDGLKNLAQRWKVKTVDALLKRLDQYAERERQKALAKGDEAKAEEVGDRCATLREICGAVTASGKHGVSDVVAFIGDLFADGAENVTVLATYHRSKGREWPRVFLLEHAARCPSKAARQPWQREQEQNLAYVAFTRAQQTLVFVD